MPSGVGDQDRRVAMQEQLVQAAFAAQPLEPLVAFAALARRQVPTIVLVAARVVMFDEARVEQRGVKARLAGDDLRGALRRELDRRRAGFRGRRRLKRDGDMRARRLTVGVEDDQWAKAPALEGLQARRDRRFVGEARLVVVVDRAPAQADPRQLEAGFVQHTSDRFGLGGFRVEVDAQRVEQSRGRPGVEVGAPRLDPE